VRQGLAGRRQCKRIETGTLEKNMSSLGYETRRCEEGGGGGGGANEDDDEDRAADWKMRRAAADDAVAAAAEDDADAGNGGALATCSAIMQMFSMNMTGESCRRRWIAATFQLS
jgi:hypothetical protein